MAWISPLPFKLAACTKVSDWAKLRPDETMLPLLPHPGAFGDVRERHIHEGVDIYAPPDTPVCAVEDGLVVGVTPLAGAATRGGYWHDMEAVLVQSKTGLIVYCEFAPLKTLATATVVKAGDQLGNIYPKEYYYRNKKGAEEGPDAHRFFHLELHDPDTRLPLKWLVGEPLPKALHDPTAFLLPISRKV